MKTKSLIFVSILLVVISFLGFSNIYSPQNHNHGLKWNTFNEVEKLQKKQAKKVVVDVYTDWCGWCKKMDKATFEDSTVGAYGNPRFYCIKLNAESNKIIRYKGQELTEQELASRWGVRGYPTTVYLDENMDVITQVSSFLNPDQFKQIMKFTGENIYKTQTWEQFIQQ